MERGVGFLRIYIGGCSPIKGIMNLLVLLGWEWAYILTDLGLGIIEGKVSKGANLVEYQAGMRGRMQ